MKIIKLLLKSLYMLLPKLIRNQYDDSICYYKDIFYRILQKYQNIKTEKFPINEDLKLELVQHIKELGCMYEVIFEKEIRESFINPPKIRIDDEDFYKSKLHNNMPDMYIYKFKNVSVIGHTDAIVFEDKFLHIELNFMEDFHDLQKQSISNLQNDSNSFLTSDDYYASKEKILDAIYESIKFNGNAIDIGCGNGTFTFLLAKYFTEIDAYDSSYSVICQAKDEQILKNVNNIQFFHSELKDMKPFKRYNLVSCMDVTCNISDDLEFLKILKSFKMLVKEEGYLLLTDSLSLTKEQVYNDESGYVAKYRNISDYKYLVEKTGFDLVKEHTIKVVTEKELTNNLFIFKNKKSY